MAAKPFAMTDGGVLAMLRLTPKASANAIRGVARDADGSAYIRAAVTAVPEGGKANAALVKLLSKTWKLPKTSLSITSGAASRRKVVHIAGDPDALYAMLEEWGRSNQ